MGNIKLPMTYYSYFKTIYSTKFMGTMLIFSIRNSNYKSPCILSMAKNIHFVGMTKPKEAQPRPSLDNPAHVQILATKAHLSN